MPDVFTHLLFGVSIALLVRKDGSMAERMLIILGAVLIDIERPFSWLLASTEFYWIDSSVALHNGGCPPFLCCSCLFLSEAHKLQGAHQADSHWLHSPSPTGYDNVSMGGAWPLSSVSSQNHIFIQSSLARLLVVSCVWGCESSRCLRHQVLDDSYSRNQTLSQE